MRGVVLEGTAFGQSTDKRLLQRGDVRLVYDRPQQALRPDLMLAYLLWIGLTGYLLNAALIAAQRHLFGRAARAGELA